MARIEQYCGVGKRKTSIARVYLRKGEGAFTINQRNADEYLVSDHQKSIALEPLSQTQLESQFDVLVNVAGGGTTGQLLAIRHGIARALLNYNEELRLTLKRAGLLRRDSRKKERKKYGQKGARARFQFSKR